MSSPRISPLAIQGATFSFSVPLKKSRYKASLGMDGSSLPKPGCQVCLSHPGEAEGGHGGLYPPAGVWHLPRDRGRRDTVFVT